MGTLRAPAGTPASLDVLAPPGNRGAPVTLRTAMGGPSPPPALGRTGALREEGLPTVRFHGPEDTPEEHNGGPGGGRRGGGGPWHGASSRRSWRTWRRAGARPGTSSTPPWRGGTSTPGTGTWRGRSPTGPSAAS